MDMDEDIIAQLEDWWMTHHGSVTEDYKDEISRLKMRTLVLGMGFLGLGGIAVLQMKMTKNLMTGMTQMAQVLGQLNSPVPNVDIPIPQHRPNGTAPFDQGPVPDVGKPFDPGPQEAPAWVKKEHAKEPIDWKEPEL